VTIDLWCDKPSCCDCRCWKVDHWWTYYVSSAVSIHVTYILYCLRSYHKL